MRRSIRLLTVILPAVVLACNASSGDASRSNDDGDNTKPHSNDVSQQGAGNWAAGGGIWAGGGSQWGGGGGMFAGGGNWWAGGGSSWAGAGGNWAGGGGQWAGG